MTLSLKTIASDCLGLSPPFSVISDVFGYIFRDANGNIFNGNSRTVSLKRQLELMQGKAVNLSIFLVGHENDFSGVVTPAHTQMVQNAIQQTRDIYGQVDLGIRKIYWRRIGVTEAGGYIIITDSSEAEDLADDFSGPNDGVDAFFVQQILNAGGWSNTDGPCDKDSKDGMTGVVVELSGSDCITAILLAHELGHYLGLPGGNDITNLMGDDSDNDGIDTVSCNSTNLSAGQGNNMKDHCFVKPPC